MSYSNDAIRDLTAEARDLRTLLAVGRGLEIRATGEELSVSEMREILAQVEAISTLLEHSPKFFVEDALRKAAAGKGSYPALPDAMRMPFETTVIESIDDGERVIVVVHEKQAKDQLTIFALRTAADNVWHVEPVVGIMVKDDVRAALVAGKPPTVSVGCIPGLAKYRQHFGDADEWTAYAATYALDLMQLLALSNVRTEIVRPPTKLVKAARKRGRKPPFEYHVLTVPVGNPTATRAGVSGSHASPRQHVRRGHIRADHWHPGEFIWVNSHMVGSAANGVVKKDYKVAA